MKLSRTVWFINGLDTEEENILDIALETKWRKSSIELITVSKLREMLGKGSMSVPKLIQTFIDTKKSDTGVSVSSIKTK